MIHQTITLASRHHYGRQVPAAALAPVLEMVPQAVRQSVRMRFEGRSRARGQKPRWLKDAADIRFLGHGGDDDTVLHFEIPRLDEAVPRLYSQGELWPTRPAACDTGLDLLADALSDVREQKTDSENFDRPLLDSIAGFKKILNGTFQGMTVAVQRPNGVDVVVTPQTVQTAKTLFANTPLPRRVRTIGRLDMLRASTNSFGLILDDGQEVRGVMADTDIGDVSPLLNQRVLVLGKAVYRASGRLLRVDADSLEATTESGSIFSAMPKPVPRKLDLQETYREQRQRGGIGAIIGRWPGDETDEEILEALRTMS